MTTWCWLAIPRSASSALARAASRKAERSGRLTSTTVVRVASPSAVTVAWYIERFASSPASGPKQLAPAGFVSMYSLQAAGRLNKRSV